MKERPKVKVKLTSIDKILEILGLFALLVVWILTISNYPNLPEIIPTHYNARGEADIYSTKSLIFVFPIIATILFLIFTVLSKFPHTFNYHVEITPENAPIHYTTAARLIRVLKLIVVVIFGLVLYYTIVYNTGIAKEIGVWLLPIIILIILIPIIYFFIKLSLSKNKY